LYALGRLWKPELDHEADVAEESSVELTHKIGRHNLGSVIGLHSLQRAPDLDVGTKAVAILDFPALAKQCIGLVKQQDHSSLPGNVRCAAQIRFRLSKLFVDHTDRLIGPKPRYLTSW